MSPRGEGQGDSVPEGFTLSMTLMGLPARGVLLRGRGRPGNAL